jgi:L-ascorbate metabolism protein UlaG (beta-lactamase superfamily)
MHITYIHHSGFLVETRRCYYIFDYESGALPAMDPEKPVFVLSSHSHGDHYRPEVFDLLRDAGMQSIRAVLSHDIVPPAGIDTLSVLPNAQYTLNPRQRVTTFRSTDLGVAFLVEDEEHLIYHAGDLNDWVWEGEPEAWNAQMTADYRRQIRLLGEALGQRSVDAAFVVLDPRQEADYDRGMCFFLEHIVAKQVYPMHYWGNPGIIETFLQDHPQYQGQIQKTEETAQRAERGSL